MKMNVKDRIKTMLASRGVKMKTLVEMLSKKYGKRYTPSNFSSKLSRGTIIFAEFELICELLGYDIELKDKEENFNYVEK